MTIPIHEQILFEKTFALAQDVDYIYNVQYKKDIEGIQAWINGGEPYQIAKYKPPIESEDLSSKHAQRGHKLKPITIFNTFGTGNHYDSKGGVINITIHEAAYNILLEVYRDNPNTADFKTEIKNVLVDSQIRGFFLEFTSTKIKSTIYHELAHWLDDALHNGHIGNMVDKLIADPSDKSYKRFKNQGKNNVNASTVEINSQIHDVKSFKREVPQDIWDRLTFNDIVPVINSLRNVSKVLVGQEKTEWRKAILSRLHREKLLGRNMR